MHTDIPWYILPIISFILSLYFLIIKEPADYLDYRPELFGLAFMFLTIGILIGHWV